METFEQRLRGFLYSSPQEYAGRIIDSIDSLFVPKLREAENRQMDEMFFLGSHAVMQTICQQIYGRPRDERTHFYLKRFVNGSRRDLQFSRIARQLHDWRNVLAHQWFSGRQHSIIFDRQSPRGWQMCGRQVIFNPTIYADQFLSGFEQRRFWTPGRSRIRWASNKRLLVRKYQFLADWLHLGRDDRIRVTIRGLNVNTPLTALRQRESTIRRQIEARFL